MAQPFHPLAHAQRTLYPILEIIAHPCLLFIVFLFIVAKNYNQPRHPSTDELIMKVLLYRYMYIKFYIYVCMNTMFLKKSIVFLEIRLTLITYDYITTLIII